MFRISAAVDGPANDDLELRVSVEQEDITDPEIARITVEVTNGSGDTVRGAVASGPPRPFGILRAVPEDES